VLDGERGPRIPILRAPRTLSMSGQIPASPVELLELTVILPVFNEVEILPLLWPELIGGPRRALASRRDHLRRRHEHGRQRGMDPRARAAGWESEPRPLRPACWTRRGPGCRLSGDFHIPPERLLHRAQAREMGQRELQTRSTRPPLVRSRPQAAGKSRGRSPLI